METTAKHVERVVLVWLLLFRIAGNERGGGFNAKVAGNLQNGADQVKVKALLAHFLHSHRPGLDAKIKAGASRLRHLFQKLLVHAVHAGRGPPAMAPAFYSFAEFQHLAPVDSEHVVIELEL